MGLAFSGFNHNRLLTPVTGKNNFLVVTPPSTFTRFIILSGHCKVDLIHRLEYNMLNRFAIFCNLLKTIMSCVLEQIDDLVLDTVLYSVESLFEILDDGTTQCAWKLFIVHSSESYATQ